MLSVAALLSVAQSTAWAQDTSVATVDQPLDAPRYNALTIQPIELFSGTLNLEYEGVVMPYLTFTAGLNLLLYRGVFPVTYQQSFGVGPELGARFYPMREAPAGLWFGPSAGVSYIRNESGGKFADSLGYSVGAMVGYNVIINRFEASLGLGGGWIDYSSNPTGAERVGMYGFVPRLKVSMGFVF